MIHQNAWTGCFVHVRKWFVWFDTWFGNLLDNLLFHPPSLAFLVYHLIKWWYIHQSLLHHWMFANKQFLTLVRRSLRTLWCIYRIGLDIWMPNIYAFFLYIIMELWSSTGRPLEIFPILQLITKYQICILDFKGHGTIRPGK